MLKSSSLSLSNGLVTKPSDSREPSTCHSRRGNTILYSA
jgi:hypothetical protein